MLLGEWKVNWNSLIIANLMVKVVEVLRKFEAPKLPNIGVPGEASPQKEVTT